MPRDALMLLKESQAKHFSFSFFGAFGLEWTGAIIGLVARTASVSDKARRRRRPGRRGHARVINAAQLRNTIGNGKLNRTE